VVWPWTSLRAFEYASVCVVLLPARHGVAVRYVFFFQYSQIHNFVGGKDLTMYDYGRRKVGATKKSGGKSSSELLHPFTPPLSCCRYREAIECLKRALIGADTHEITINLRLAQLHHGLEEYSEAVAYHRRVVEVCQVDSTYLAFGFIL
jgi:hypothetical protein